MQTIEGGITLCLRKSTIIPFVTDLLRYQIKGNIRMPSYTVTFAEGRLSVSQGSQIAEAISRAHSDLTGAPCYFVQVTLNGVRPGNYFLGGVPLSGDQIFVHGFIRDGRPVEMKDVLIARLTTDIA